MSKKDSKESPIPLRKKTYTEALAAIDVAIKNSLRGPNLRMRRAWIHIEYSQWQHALDDLQAALAIDPTLVDAYMKIGAIYGMANQLDLAIPYLSQAIQLAPHNADAYFNRGRAYFTQQNYPAAIADFSRLLQLEPQNGAIDALRGMCYEATGQFAKALADAERFLPFAPTAEARQKT